MLKIVLTLLAMAGALALAPLMIDEKGYILIAWNNSTIDGTLVSFGVLLCLAFAVSYLVYRVLRYVLSLYGVTRFRISEKSARKQLTNLKQGLWAYFSHDNVNTTKLLAKSAVPKDWQGLSYAVAAKAALAQGDKKSALSLLANLPEAEQKFAAPLYVELEQFEVAEKLLMPIAEDKKSSVVDLALYSQFLIKQKNWTELSALIPRLEKKQVLAEAQWQSLFSAYFTDITEQDLHTRYQALSRKLKPVAETSYLKAMLKIGNVAEVEPKLIKWVKKQLFTQVIDLLSIDSSLQLPKLQQLIQQWLKKQPEEQNLLLCLAYLAKSQQDFQLSAKVFTALFNQYPELEQQHWRVAVACYNQQNEQELALALYQKHT